MGTKNKFRGVKSRTARRVASDQRKSKTSLRPKTPAGALGVIRRAGIPNSTGELLYPVSGKEKTDPAKKKKGRVARKKPTLSYVHSTSSLPREGKGIRGHRPRERTQSESDFHWGEHHRMNFSMSAQGPGQKQQKGRRQSEKIKSANLGQCRTGDPQTVSNI